MWCRVSTSAKRKFSQSERRALLSAEGSWAAPALIRARTMAMSWWFKVGDFEQKIERGFMVWSSTRRDVMLAPCAIRRLIISKD